MAVLEESVLELSPRVTHEFPGGNAYTFRWVAGGRVLVSAPGKGAESLEKEGDEAKIPHTSNGSIFVAVGEAGGSIYFERQEPEHPNDGLADEDNPGLQEPDPADAPILQHPDKGVLIKDPDKVLGPDEAREEPTFDRGLSLDDRLRALDELDDDKEIVPGVSADGKRDPGGRGRRDSLVTLPTKGKKGKKPPKPDATPKVPKGSRGATDDTKKARTLSKEEKGGKGRTRSQKTTRDNVKKGQEHSPRPEAKRDVRKKK